MHKGKLRVSDVSQFQLQNYSNKLHGRQTEFIFFGGGGVQTRAYIMKLGRLKIVAHHGWATKKIFQSQTSKNTL